MYTSPPPSPTDKLSLILRYKLLTDPSLFWPTLAEKKTRTAKNSGVCPPCIPTPLSNTTQLCNCDFSLKGLLIDHCETQRSEMLLTPITTTCHRQSRRMALENSENLSNKTTNWVSKRTSGFLCDALVAQSQDRSANGHALLSCTSHNPMQLAENIPARDLAPKAKVLRCPAGVSQPGGQPAKGVSQPGGWGGSSMTTRT